jgi:rubrerythrin
MEPVQIGLFKEAIELELNVSGLYRVYSEIFEDDSKFWLQFSNEEKNHAILLQTALDQYLNTNLFPIELFYSDIEELRQVNNVLKQLKEEYSGNPPDKKTAYAMALSIEESNQEKQFNLFIDKTPPGSKALKLFQSLNDDNKNHVERIKSLVNKT